jgi:hypothetical protein
LKSFKVYATLAALFFIAIILFYTITFYGFLDPETRGSLAVFDLIPALAALFALVSVSQLLLVFRRGDPPRLIWTLILAAVLLNLIAEITWFVYEIIIWTEVPYPSLADYFWLASYIPFFLAITILISRYRKMGLTFRRRSLFVVIPLIVIILVLVTIAVTAPIFSDPEAALADKLINPAYVYLDFIILVPALLMTFAFAKGAQGKPWQLIAYCFILFAVGDIAYAYMAWNGLYSTGNHIDILWTCGYLLLAIAAAYQKDMVRRG